MQNKKDRKIEQIKNSSDARMRRKMDICRLPG
jgi:hypothetical protein